MKGASDDGVGGAEMRKGGESGGGREDGDGGEVSDRAKGVRWEGWEWRGGESEERGRRR